ncbi:MAG: nucleotidyltransferase domain-containing protein [Candidatus Sumerlaeota bacterium]|nr:nucleotidyltransferase domain-containing protein [Candidatus Sumerlaeota bacterium]
MVDRAIVNTVRGYLRRLRESGLAIRFGVVYGSQTTGKAHKWSDIDLLVVAPEFDDMKDRRHINFLWETAAVVDSSIEPIACGERRWEQDDWTPILEIARREGQKVYPDGDA